MSMGITFGPSGWQGRIDQELTEENIIRVAHILVRHLLESHSSSAKVKAAIGFDGRANSGEIAVLLAAIFSDSGIEVLLSSGIVPTPALSFAVLTENCTSGIMVTGGDLPHEYNGLEFKGAYGGPFTHEAMAMMEFLLGSHPPNSSGLQGRVKGEIVRRDLLPEYVAHIESLIDLPALRSFAADPRNNANVLVDSMGGSGQTIIEDVLVRCGWRAQTLFSSPVRTFFDRTPEAVSKNLDALKYNVRVIDALFGVATDGDASQCAVVDENGVCLNLHESTMALLWHLYEQKGEAGRFLKPATLSDRVMRVLKDWNISTVDIGLDNGIDEFLKIRPVLCCSGLGGYRYGRHLPECDGIITALLFAEMLAKQAKPLGLIRAFAHQGFGIVHYCMIDEVCNQLNARQMITAIRSSQPKQLGLFGRYEVETYESRGAACGLKVRWGECRWFLIQIMHLKSAVRLHCEGESESEVSAILDAGRKLLLA